MKKTLLLWMLGLLLTVQVYAQNRSLSGTVKDAATGEALIGVNVTGKGTTIGTVTDIDGKYTLELPKEVSTLVFSYVGYTNVEKPILSLVVDATLSTDAKIVDEVVVTAVAIKREKRSTSFATTTVKSDDLNQTAGTALTALQGKAPGVRITQGSGQVGSASRVVLRGEVSIGGNNNALIVVDGIPINNRYSGDDNQFLSGYVDLGNRSNDINPDDIESISVLKGPAATALYGSRASSGVLLITTKKGAQSAKDGRKLKVNVSTGLSFDQAYLMYKRQNQFGEGFDKKIVFGENFSWGPAFDGVVRPWTNPFVDENGNTVQLYKPYSAVKDQVKNFFDIGITNTNNISIEGGSDAFNYRVSYGNINNKGVVPYTGYNRHNLSLAAEAKLSDKLHTDFTVTYSKSNIKAASAGTEFANPMQTIVQTPIDIPLSDFRDYNNPFYSFQGYYGAYTPNPYYILANATNTNNSDNILGQVTINYKPIKNLDLVARVGNNFTSSFIELRTPIYEYAVSHLNADGSPGAASIGRYYESLERSNDLNIDLYANYKNNFGKKKRFNFNALGGFNYVDSRTLVITGRTNGGLGFPDVYDLKNSVAQPLVDDNKIQRRLSGVYGNINFGYNNLIFFEYSARNDWSSTLPANNRGFFYQSGGLSFVPTELFKTPNKWLNYLKLRFNAGSVGKDPLFAQMNTSVLINPEYDDYSIPDYKYVYPINVNDASFTGLTISNAAGNDKIKPELTISYEGGADFGFFDDRLTANITGYYQLSKNQIIRANTAPSSGFSSALMNVGKVSNKGVELGVNATPIRNIKGVTWSFYLNYAMNRSKVLKVSDEKDEAIIGGTTAVTIVAKENMPFGVFKANTYQYDSLGRMIISYATGYPVPSTTQGYFGSYQPKYTMGFGSTFGWKGLSVSVAFDLRKGGLFYSTTKEQGEFNGTSITTVVNDRVPYVLPNTAYVDPVSGQTVANTTLATAVDYGYFAALPESANLVDASYVKLREVAIRYSVPAKFFKNTPLSSISIGAFGRNLKTWVPKSNTFADPEMGAYSGSNSNIQGYEAASTPYARSYGFEFKLGF